ncbi:PREDICTED: isoprenoid synthase domain-containing protein-like [Priapulus caudatus]|uniref:Isoprenoid synthase domain-containing protein-like n=1 Tax=Priapulus caudatus TaxID=37621 RepID=A0ABM1EXU0_PRICU|nr:PREDICTED: isoprenoid synthase domain-containing protein-like [Priapulus caudatus]
MDFRVSVVLPAGGNGVRMRHSVPKQFCLIEGRSVLAYTIECFERIAWVESIIVAVATEHVAATHDIIAAEGFVKTKVTVGGDSRHRSIRSGIDALRHDPPDVVVVHDAVRPILHEKIVRDVAIAANKHGVSTHILISMGGGDRIR